MDSDSGDEVEKNQKFMIVWKLNLKYNHNMNKIEIYTPHFSLNPTNKEETVNWIRLERFEDKLKIESNFAFKKELKSCSTYMMHPLLHKALAEYRGFGTFSWKHIECCWSEEMRIIFEVEMQYSASGTPIIWQHCSTKTRPSVNTGIFLDLKESDMANHTVLNDQRVSCVVKRISHMTNTEHSLVITPKEAPENWNLLAVIVKKLENNVFEWQYQHTTNSRTYGSYFPNTTPVIIIDILDLYTSLENG